MAFASSDSTSIGSAYSINGFGGLTNFIVLCTFVSILCGTTEVVPFPILPLKFEDEPTKSKSKAADRSVRPTQASLPAPRLQQVRLIKRRHRQPLHGAREILTDFK